MTSPPSKALPLCPFANAAIKAVADALDMDPSHFVVSAPPKPSMGEFAVGCFPGAKEHRTSPQALASQVAKSFQPGPFLSAASASGPFVNFRVAKDSLFRHLFSTAESGSLVPTHPGHGKTICIDFSSPNISKQLAYHHIRSTVIGHALVNLYRAIGYKVVGINHLGDWGTTHGMLLAAHHRWPPTEPISIADLNDLYVRFRAAMTKDNTLEEEARTWFAKLEAGDHEARRKWQHFKDVSWSEFQRAYDVLGISFDEVKGESEYVSDMPAVLKMLDDKKLSSVSDGALVVMLPEEGMPPLLLKKQDGATLYATRDLAAAMHRHKTYAFTRNLYVVDRGQSLHFKQLFKTLELAGFDWAAGCQHVPFGLVRIGGKKTSSKKGNVVLLMDVFAEATERAAAVIRSNNPTWTQQEVDEIAPIVGVGAVVFANLMSQRDKDVDFDWEDVLSTTGDSGAYVQYAHARCCTLLEKSGKSIDTDVDVNLLGSDLEVQLGCTLLRYADVVAKAAHHNDPHVLSRYLLDLVADFSRWYTAGNQDKSQRILCSDEGTQRARLALVVTTRAYLRHGLNILGLKAPVSM